MKQKINTITRMSGLTMRYYGTRLQNAKLIKIMAISNCEKMINVTRLVMNWINNVKPYSRL